MKAHLCHLVYGSAIYNIWIYRNAQCHEDHPKTEEQVIKQITREVKMRLLVKGKFKTTKGNEVLCGLWGIWSYGVIFLYIDF